MLEDLRVELSTSAHELLSCAGVPHSARLSTLLLTVGDERYLNLSWVRSDQRLEVEQELLSTEPKYVRYNTFPVARRVRSQLWCHSVTQNIPHVGVWDSVENALQQGAWTQKQLRLIERPQASGDRYLLPPPVYRPNTPGLPHLLVQAHGVVVNLQIPRDNFTSPQFFVPMPSVPTGLHNKLV